MADERIPAILLLDPLGLPDKTHASVALLSTFIPKNVKIVILSTSRDQPVWQQAHIQFVSATNTSYAQLMGQLRHHAIFNWLLIAQVGSQLATDTIADIAQHQKNMQTIGPTGDMQKKDAVYLQFGCKDQRLEHFINLDLDAPDADMQLNQTNRLPWENASVAGIYSNGFIEQLTQANAVRLLSESRRVLTPGGTIRIATTDLAAVVHQYVTGSTPADPDVDALKWPENACEQLNLSMRWNDRKWLFDETELTHLALLTGLEVKGKYPPGESTEAMLQDREQPGSPKLIMELVKPERQLAPAALPLVSITIPSYNPRFFECALESAVKQTYTNLDILVSDDCPSQEIKDITERFMKTDKRIRYMRNPSESAGKDQGGSNYLNCYYEARGEFLKYLNDDDVLALHCVERMIDAFRKYPDVVLVTSKRHRINAHGQKLLDTVGTASIAKEDSLLDGRLVGKTLLSSRENFIGEPSTAMFRKRELADIKPAPTWLAGEPIRGMLDVCLWMNLLTKGDLVYLVEPLSLFRVHGEQVQVILRDSLVSATLESWDQMTNHWTRMGLL